MIEVGPTSAGHGLDYTTAPLERQPRGLVVRRNSRQDLARHGDQCADERLLDRRLDRQVHQQQRRAQKGFVGYACGGRREQRGAVGGRGVRQLGFRLLRQLDEVVSGATGVDQRRSRNAGQANVGQRARERARKAGRSGDNAEVVEGAAFRGVERDTAGNRFDTERGARGDSLPCQARGCNAGGELREAEARDAERRAAPSRHPACEVVGRAACRRNDGDELVGRKPIKETGSAIEPDGCRSGFDDRERS